MNKIFRFLFALILSLSAVDCFACSCLNLSTQQRYQKASDIFLGKVIETKLVSETQGFGEQEITSHKVRATISVTREIKGKHSQQIDVEDSVADGANCGVGLLTGREYLFYLYDDQSVSICGGSKLYNEFSDKDLIEELLSY